LSLARNHPIVCYVTDRKALNAPTGAASLVEKIRGAIAADVDCVQVREKDMPACQLLAVARAAVDVAGSTRIIVNDRLDVAIASGAGGVHLGGESIPARDAIRWCRAGNAPKAFLVGVSCHSLEGARRAEVEGVDYIFFGPVFDTPAKRAFGVPQGVERLAEVCRTVRVPLIAIGGINAKNARDCIHAGAAGIAAIRLFQEPGDPQAMKNVVARLHG
jgi:thiamine-phosphate pyrophosphorylase